jgi:methionyl-tRNA formyltransferase
LTLDGRPGAATFFLIDEGADSGPVLAQELFYVSTQDYAADVIAKSEAAIDRALDRWLPRLLAGEWDPQPQQHELATYNGKRAPEDGLIDWSGPAEQIHALVRATSRPHPGAYTYVGEHKLIIWRAELETALPFRGVPGRIVHVDPQKGWLVQTGLGLLWMTDLELVADGEREAHPTLRVGTKLGYIVEDELCRMKQHVTKLEKRLRALEKSSKQTVRGHSE